MRSGGEVENLNKEKEVEEGDERLVEQEKNKEESTSPDSEEKNEEVETISKMTPRAFVLEEFPSKDIPYILEVEELIVSFHENKEAPIENKTIKSFEEKVFKLLFEHNYRFTKKDEGKNHQPIHSW